MLYKGFDSGNTAVSKLMIYDYIKVLLPIFSEFITE